MVSLATIITQSMARAPPLIMMMLICIFCFLFFICLPALTNQNQPNNQLVMLTKLLAAEPVIVFASCQPITHPKSNRNPETQLVDISSRVQILESGDLLISNIRSVDAGLYICVRANEAGSVKGEAYLSVLGEFPLYQDIQYPASSIQ